MLKMQDMTLKEKETRAKTFADYCINGKEMDFDRDSLEFGFIKGLESGMETQNNMEQNEKLNPFVRIRGVKGRGKEVIAELERRSGVDHDTHLTGEDENAWYTLSPSGRIFVYKNVKDTDSILANYEEIRLPKKKASVPPYRWLSIYESSYSSETGLLSVSGYLSLGKPEGSKADGYIIAKIKWEED